VAGLNAAELGRLARVSGAGNRRKLQRLLSLLNSPEMADLYRG
jgi:hypothetical protein